MPRAVVGLGNPGSRYAGTRHNAGFLLVDLLARRHGVTLSARRYGAAWAEIELAGHRTALIEPLGFMNLSGPPVAAFATDLGIDPEAILVLHDDLDLAPARVRMKRGGGTAGHRGLDSIVESLGTRDFPRLRIGIGRPPAGLPVVDFVLAPFDEEARVALDGALEQALSGIEIWARDGIEAAMAVVHAPALPRPPGAGDGDLSAS
ncbi:MAG: aminoacyl-tRNA hydrolase [Deltaproteobacteria bacterium]|nr:aminoacyl-tRNA hydrolase [Deltaproteobacteria bacterium]